jgi:hypothetical protein
MVESSSNRPGRLRKNGRRVGHAPRFERAHHDETAAHATRGQGLIGKQFRETQSEGRGSGQVEPRVGRHTSPDAPLRDVGATLQRQRREQPPRLRPFDHTDERPLLGALQNADHDRGDQSAAEQQQQHARPQA